MTTTATTTSNAVETDARGSDDKVRVQVMVNGKMSVSAAIALVYPTTTRQPQISTQAFSLGLLLSPDIGSHRRRGAFMQETETKCGVDALLLYNRHGLYLGWGRPVTPTILTLYGSPQNLLKAVDLLLRNDDCTEPTILSLSVARPYPQTMDALAKASFACKDNPGTLGLDRRANAMVAVKTFPDMKLLLNSFVKWWWEEEDFDANDHDDALDDMHPNDRQPFCLHHLARPNSGAF